MFEYLTNLLSSEDDKDLSFIKLTRRLLILVIVVNTVVLIINAGVSNTGSSSFIIPILSSTLALEIIAYIYVLRGNIMFAKIIVPIGLLVAIGVLSSTANGVRDVSFFAVPTIIVISAILLGRNSLFIIAPFAVIITTIITLQDVYSGKVASPIGFDDIVIINVLIAAGAGITHLLVQRLNESIARAKESEALEKNENIELTSLRASLEERVQIRTNELENANRVSEKRARQFQAVAKVMNAISTVQSLDALLPLITQVISEQFNVYHTGVFLIDKQGENAILRAANSEGGQRMLERKHSLPVGQTGIVGYVTGTGQARIVLDVGDDSIFFDNPDLPNTRSEIALPLRYAGKIIGALDVQSTEANAFQQDDLSILLILADQVAVAINNALTIENAQRALAEAQSAIGQVAQEAWQVLRPSKLGLGFTYSNTGIKPLEHPLDSDQIREATSKGKVMLTKGDGQNAQMAVPIRLRGQVIGVMQLKSNRDITLTEDDADIASAVAERLSLAIETATLLQSTQHRADLERITANITARISSSSRFETILQTAAQELSKALGGSDVLVQVEPAALKMYT